MPVILLLFIIAGGLFLLGVGVFLAVALLGQPDWLSRSFASTFGGFAGASAAMIAVFIVGCVCAVMGCAIAFFVVGQIPVG